MNEYELGVSIIEAGNVPQVPRFVGPASSPISPASVSKEIEALLTVNKIDGHLRPTPGDEKKFPPDRYNQIVNEVFAQVNKLSKLKGDEYAAGADRLANFRDAAKRLDLPMEIIWQVYTQKHWDAITQYIKDIKSGTKRKRMEPPSGRVLDVIVYLLLLLSMMEERDGTHVKIA